MTLEVKPGFEIVIGQDGKERYRRMQLPKEKPPKEGYNIIIDKNGNQRYQKILTEDRRKQLTEQLREKALPKARVRQQEIQQERKQQGVIKQEQAAKIIHDAHTVDRDDIRSIREKMDELKSIVKEAIKMPKVQERTQSAPKNDTIPVIQQQMKELAERPVVYTEPEPVRKPHRNPNLAKYGF